jgi:hypothetical protein
MNHRNRLRRLERDMEVGKACDLCGHGANTGNQPYTVSWLDDNEVAGPEWCPGCGRQLTVIVRWPEDPDYRPAQRVKQVWP